MVPAGSGGDFFVHVGWDQYVYVGSSADCRRAVAFAHKHGLFAEPISGSPYVFGLDDDDHTDVRSADAAFWAALAGLVDELGPALLEEGYVHNDLRWHRLTRAPLTRSVTGWHLARGCWSGRN